MRAPTAGRRNRSGANESDCTQVRRKVRSNYGSSDISLVYSASAQAREVQVRTFPREPSASANFVTWSPRGASAMTKLCARCRPEPGKANDATPACHSRPPRRSHSVHISEHFVVLGVSDLLAGVDVNKDGHWSLSGFRPSGSNPRGALSPQRFSGPDERCFPVKRLANKLHASRLPLPPHQLARRRVPAMSKTNSK